MTADIHTLTGAYALHALPEDERREFERHRAVCDACQREVEELQRTASELASAVSTPAPASIRAAVMGRVDLVRQEAPPVAVRRRPRPWMQRLLAPAAAVLATVALGLTAVVASQQGRIDRLETSAMVLSEILAAPDARTVQLTAPDGGAATLVLSATRGEGVLTAAGLAPAPAGRVYELWLIGPDGAAPAGLFTPDDRGRVGPRTFTGDVAGALAIGVTIEPAGGSPQPTSDPIMLADVQAA